MLTNLSIIQTSIIKFPNCTFQATDTSDSNPDLWFNPDNTGAANTSVTLKALKLENFAAIYRNGRDHLEDSLKEICQVVEIPFRLEECLDSQQNIRTTLYMNYYI